ncbi:hypothetical protein ABL840_20705 [Variovorax sp. NFACC27]|jgi:hypothetical protein|uniref:hypothetical protein n=1 Tax=unclassified Variovorax TaxID=663243 RepID=UPI0008974584|nr:hypothetical protein [Variovorax sp. YR750]MDP9606519.1 hypothetical protein [Variovorax paradoxus]SEF33671.1 hypothetical protein SAMN03159371_06686 [Variovorax sp. NFACC28]SEG96536.1 hypothetical protein SAMN03159365_06590 [Variovorax sp. NFACC29]SFD97728.1 hypothetical protein SAMN03159379_06949 [Variovorax sp. NFACC26]SFH14866.1 hypothetical protein SAMN03159447_06913 [Variovorax sp. NFACC27]
MNRTEILATIVDMGRAGLGFTPVDALDVIAELIAREDPRGSSYDINVERLLRLGTTIWSLRHRLFLPVEGHTDTRTDAL